MTIGTTGTIGMMIGTTVGTTSTTCASREWTQIGTVVSPGENGGATTARSPITTGTTTVCCRAPSCVRAGGMTTTGGTTMTGRMSGATASRFWTAMTTAISRRPN